MRSRIKFTGLSLWTEKLFDIHACEQGSDNGVKQTQTSKIKPFLKFKNQLNKCTS